MHLDNEPVSKGAARRAAGEPEQSIVLEQAWMQRIADGFAGACPALPNVVAPAKKAGMRPRRLRRLYALMGFGAILAGAVLGTGIAKADDLTFVQALNNHGIVVYDAATALTWGHAICIALNQTTGDVVAGNFYRLTNADIPNIATAVTWVVVAVEQLCPWQDHRGRMAV